MSECFELSEISPLISEAVKNGGCFYLSPKGKSMHPTIREGKDKVILEEFISFNQSDEDEKKEKYYEMKHFWIEVQKLRRTLSQGEHIQFRPETFLENSNGRNYVLDGKIQMDTVEYNVSKEGLYEKIENNSEK